MYVHSFFGKKSNLSTMSKRLTQFQESYLVEKVAANLMPILTQSYLVTTLDKSYSTRHHIL